MNVVRKYDIAYKGLGEGRHEFGFDMDDGFFASFDNPEILGGKATARVTLDKLPASLMLEFDIEGEVSVQCDRCLEPCALPVDYHGELAVKFTDEEIPEGESYDGEVMWLGYNESVINLAQYIYESVILSLPYQRVHPDSGCDPDMLGRFNIVTEEEFEKIAQNDEQSMEDNPEWEKLRQLREKMGE